MILVKEGQTVEERVAELVGEVNQLTKERDILIRLLNSIQNDVDDIGEKFSKLSTRIEYLVDGVEKGSYSFLF